ncbi:hypothetical protein SDC9_177870 [bioreactor metagenome]|uniref:Uncharacterized protein n=1 Tax=bioreactor metagenome TaxID=1076179 RepID=A0A645GXA5_9ZZZZ
MPVFSLILLIQGDKSAITIKGIVVIDPAIVLDKLKSSTIQYNIEPTDVIGALRQIAVVIITKDTRTLFSLIAFISTNFLYFT